MRDLTVLEILPCTRPIIATASEVTARGNLNILRRNTLCQPWNHTQSLWEYIPWEIHTMMTSSNGNIFRVTGPLCGEFTGHLWIPLTKASDAELRCFLCSSPWINGWLNNREAGDLRRHRAHYDVIVMRFQWAFFRHVYVMILVVELSSSLISVVFSRFTWCIYPFHERFSIVIQTRKEIYLECTVRIEQPASHL